MAFQAQTTCIINEQRRLRFSARSQKGSPPVSILKFVLLMTRFASRVACRIETMPSIGFMRSDFKSSGLKVVIDLVTAGSSVASSLHHEELARRPGISSGFVFID